MSTRPFKKPGEECQPSGRHPEVIRRCTRFLLSVPRPIASLWRRTRKPAADGGDTILMSKTAGLKEPRILADDLSIN